MAGLTVRAAIERNYNHNQQAKVNTLTVTGDQLKAAARLYPTGVAVVTTAPEGVAPFGITVNSYTSLSLEPPLIMWNLQRSSDTFKEWHEAQTFAVNFLKAGQEDLSTRFASQGGHQITGTALAHGITGCPLLADCLSSLECTVHARYEEGDHIIMIGEVVNIESPSPDADALVYFKRGYTSIG